MKNILKAIRNMIDGVYHYVDEMVRKATESKPDWNQNDPTAPDYVKNRPFWTGDPVETVLFEGTVTISGGWISDNNFPVIISVGTEYIVTFNGNIYELTGIADVDGVPFIGNPAIWWPDEYADQDNGLPFCVGNGGVGANVADGDYALKIIGAIVEIHKIDEKYLPSTKSKYDTPVCSFMNTTSIFEAFPYGRWNDYEDWTETILTKETFDTIIELATLCDENKIYFIDRERIDSINLCSDGSIFVRICDVQTGDKCLFGETWEIDLRYDESDGIVYGKQKYRQENAVIEETPT